jgi:gliding motility-associated-like protein
LPYSWNGLIFNAAGSQTATLVNVGGCDSLATLNLTVLSPSVSINTPLSTVNVSQATQLNAVGSPAGGTYTWSPAASLSPSTGATVNATPNTTTTYTVIYDLGNGCTASATTTITVNPITLSVNGTTICSGVSTTLTATPSVTGGTYLWSPGGQTTQTISVSPNSNVVYTCVYTLNGQTVNSNPASITVLPKPVISVNSPTICSSQSATLSVTANPSGGSYLWQPGGQTTSSLSVNPTSTSNYTVIYTLNGCSDTATSIVTVNPIPTVSVNNQTICSGQSATLTASPSISGGTFLWSSSQNTTTITVSPSTTTSYGITYTLNGCQSSPVSSTVTVSPKPTISFSADKLSGCAPLVVNFSNNNTNQNSCLWNMGNGQSFSGCNNNFTFDQGGCYDITLTASENGCSNSLTLQDYICVESLPNASFTVFPIAFSQDNQTVSFNNISTGATTYSWDFGDGSFSNVLNPVRLFINTLQGYLVTLTVSSASGCSDVTQVYIGYNEGENIYIPNTFTPDADGFNQTFKPIFTSGFDPFNYEMLIYNRWGELIFETRDVNWGWDGSYRMAGRDVQQGIYTYKIAYKNPKLDQRKTIVGHVTLIK